MFTTAGSTRVTMDANELEDGMASGMASGVAPLPANAMLFMAEVRPDTTVPIRIPITSVSATNNPATIFSRRAQLNILMIGSPISVAPVFSPPPDRSCGSHPSLLSITLRTYRSCLAQVLHRKTYWPYGRGGFGGSLT